MEEIEFRGKRDDTGDWIHGFYLENHLNERYKREFGITEDVLYQIYPKSCDVDPQNVIKETVGIYTGFKDCNKVKIFSGDIVWDGVSYVLVNFDPDKRIEFGHGESGYSFCIGLFAGWGQGNDIKVVGNIHDNKDLL